MSSSRSSAIYFNSYEKKKNHKENKKKSTFYVNVIDSISNSYSMVDNSSRNKHYKEEVINLIYNKSIDESSSNFNFKLKESFHSSFENNCKKF